MTRKGSLGWIILLVALAFPAFLFYNWWSHLNSARRREMAKKVRLRIPEDRLFSSPSPQAARLTNPIAGQNPAPAAPATPAANASPESVTALAAPAAMVTAEAAAVPEEPPPLPALPQPAAPAAPEMAAQKVFRDPTLSPYDQYRLQQLELEKTIREQEMKFPSRVRAEAPREGIGIENSVRLEGIVINEENGTRAIVNGEMVSEGDSIGKVSVQRITPRGVLFLYKKKKFMKWISK